MQKNLKYIYMNIQLRDLLKCLVLVPAILLVSCQDEFDFPDPPLEGNWEIINTSNGLPGNMVTDIKLDSRGLLWVSFNGAGVSRYDGDSWLTYNTGNSEILSNNITCIEEDDDGDMWFGTTNGISFLVDGTDWYYLQDPDSIYYIQTIKRDNNGYVWTGTRNHSYIYYDYEFFTFAAMSPVAEFNKVNSIEQDKTGRIWLGTDAGLHVWDWVSWEYQSIYDYLGTYEVSSLYCDSDNRMWIGSSGGMAAAYSKNNSITGIDPLNGDLVVHINDICEDEHGDIWMATNYDGIIRFNGVHTEIFRENNGLPQFNIKAVASDKDGNIWIGCEDEGLVKYTLPLKTK